MQKIKVGLAAVLLAVGIYGFYYIFNYPYQLIASPGKLISLGIISGAALLGSALALFKLKS